MNNIKYLENTILKSDKETNEKYCDAYVKFVTKLNNKEFIRVRKINEIKKSGLIKPRMKFAIMDLDDLYKKL